MKQYKRDIKEWAQEFAVSVVRLSIQLKMKGVDYALRDQLLRSGTSIGANVREAQASSSRKELIRYYEIALRSCDETQYWINVIREGYSLPNELFEELYRELKEITRVIARIILNLKSK